jgi:hypothetical protein
MVGTKFPVVLSAVSVLVRFARHFAVSGRLGDETPALKDYLKASLLPLLAMVVLFFHHQLGWIPATNGIHHRQAIFCLAFLKGIIAGPGFGNLEFGEWQIIRRKP